MPVCICWSKPEDRGRARCSKGECRALFRHGHRRSSPGDGHRALGSGLWCTTIACTAAALMNKHSHNRAEKYMWRNP